MSDPYNQILNATVQHLEDLKARGVRFVTVSPEGLAGVSRGRRISPLKAQSLPSAPATPVSPARSPAAAIIVPPGSPDLGSTGQRLKDREKSPAEISDSPQSEKKPIASADVKAKEAAFAALRERAMVCVKCPHLASSRKNVVFGVGNINAELMFIGEAPGADEDEQAEPFVGKAGQLLTKIIQTAGLSRESVYIANILKCRPDTPGQSAGNRKPTPEEMQTCIPYLHEQIDLIRPKVIVALGGTAVEGLLGKTVFITRLRGQWQTYRGIPLMPTYHPSYLLRKQSLTEKRDVWEDMLQVMEKLGMPISDKQRRFFLQGTT